MKQSVALLVVLLLSGCATAPAPVLDVPPLVQAPVSRPLQAAVLDDVLPGMPARPPIRDPFSHVRPVPVERHRVPPRIFHPLRTAIGTPAHAVDGIVRTAVVAPEYAVEGIVRTAGGPVAILTGREGHLLVQPGSPLGHFTVAGINADQGVVNLTGDGHRFTLLLRPLPGRPHSQSDIHLSQEAVPGDPNRG